MLLSVAAYSFDRALRSVRFFSWSSSSATSTRRHGVASWPGKRHLEALFHDEFGMELPISQKPTSAATKRTFEGKLKNSLPGVLDLD